MSQQSQPDAACVGSHAPLSFVYLRHDFFLFFACQVVHERYVRDDYRCNDVGVQLDCHQCVCCRLCSIFYQTVRQTDCDHHCVSWTWGGLGESASLEWWGEWI